MQLMLSAAFTHGSPFCNGVQVRWAAKRLMMALAAVSWSGWVFVSGKELLKGISKWNNRLMLVTIQIYVHLEVGEMNYRQLVHWDVLLWHTIVCHVSRLHPRSISSKVLQSSLAFWWTSHPAFTSPQDPWDSYIYLANYSNLIRGLPKSWLFGIDPKHLP